MSALARRWWGPRPYYRYPWTERALAEIQRLRAQRLGYRAIALELERRQLADGRPDPRTVRRAALRIGVRS